jgi:nitrogen fixation/metabolism regulation signal transduction histidine kinase
VLGAPAQLRQVIHNLLQNSQDALAGSSDPKIEVETVAAPTGRGGQAWLKIVDNGCGFSTDIMERAFEPYVTTKPKGSGLGLAIVKKIIDEHQGTISIENRRPHGAAVVIALPLAA